ncbi:MAG: endonuclease/exonuclease/phosphatase family protein [Silvibacterium sp.]
MFLPASGGAVAVAVQLVLLLALIFCSKASAQNEHGSDYIGSSRPPLLKYQELVALGEQETVDPALAAKLHTLLTTPFVNNEAYFSGVKPIRPDLDGRGPSLRLVEWNIERGIEFDAIKLLLTDKQGFLAKVHSAAANNTNAEKTRDEVLDAQMDVLQSAEVLVLNEVDWGMKRSDYRAVAEDLADALKMNWAYGVEFVEGRTNLIATIDVPDLPGQQVTIVATHLENRTTPKGRVKEMDEILDMVRPISHPVIIAGDMNTTGQDGSVLSIKSAALKKLNNPAFWATQGVKYATGVGVIMDVASFGFKTAKFQADPTASGVPLLAANPEQGLFKELNKYRFDDGTRIDFRGDAALSVNGREGTLGNSNERASKGFVTTFALPRTLAALGKFRLDWIFVKGYLKDDPGAADSYRFAPAFARTMNEANEALSNPLSDHASITVDLPIIQPALSGSKK